jgi:hypothetical protein
MQLLLLLLFNLFMGAVMYLVISLKLERSATEFRERKLRKEMDEIIREFNATAERNISILENRIKTLRRLLEKSGDIKMFDIMVDEAENIEVSEKPLLRSDVRAALDAKEGRGADTDFPSGTGRGDIYDGRDMKKGLPLFIERLINILSFRSSKSREDHFDAGSVPDNRAAIAGGSMTAEVTGDPIAQSDLLEKDLTGVVPAYGIDEQERESLSEEEVLQIVSSATDKYSLVSLLHERGCTIEDISHYAGIPLGEVRLVLNLNNTL